jgi:outer membrane protein OmpA-like peptidoglycan-associated protein
MTTSLRTFGLAGAFTLWAVTAGAQTPAPAASQSSSTTNSSTASTSDTRPATTTFFGDTGLWFVPTAEVLPAGKWSVSGYRRGTNYIQGYTNVADFAGTFGYGIKGRAEVFGSMLVDTRIDRDLRPLFVNDSTVGGVVGRNPLVRQGWTGDNVGDLFLGVKYNLWSEADQRPAAFAVRAMVKAPTGKKDDGVSTGKPDFHVDFIASKEEMGGVDVSAFAGYEYRGKPDGFSIPTSALNWGVGAAFPSRSPLRVTGELDGFVTGKTATLSGASLVGADNSVPPAVSNLENLTRATVGLTYQMPKGFFLGGGISWNVPRKTRDPNLTSSDDKDPLGDFVDWQVRIGYHPGVRKYVAPAPPPPPPPPPPVAQNRPPTVRAQCDPCTVMVGQTSTVTATAQDPDGDPLTFRWTAPTGTFQNPAVAQTIWTAPQQVGPVPATVTVSDGKGGTASDMVTINVIAPPPVVQLTFEDIYFDFDRSTLRPEALRLLDDAVMKLMANPDKNIIIEGHTCNIGTAEYNLALGDRRAASVRDYLVSRGVPATRLETRSYGEEAPKYDNAREETRRLNRRAALVVKVQ